jgi:catechol 2,3-dioxygenase-like lactoylglutathione lyase family enzyme
MPRLWEDRQELKGRTCMISGAHVVLYSENAEADLAFFRDIFGFPHVEAGDGWLIFAMPPAELAVHPAHENDRHELFFMCKDLKAEMAALAGKQIQCSEVQQARWGMVTKIQLPGGGRVGLYQPKHRTALEGPTNG